MSWSLRHIVERPLTYLGIRLVDRVKCNVDTRAFYWHLVDAMWFVIGPAICHLSLQAKRMSMTSRHRRRLWLAPLVIWVVLTLLLGVNTWLGYKPLRGMSVAANLAVVAVMVALLAVFLTRLRGAVGTAWLAGLAGLMFLLTTLLLTFGDYLTR